MEFCACVHLVRSVRCIHIRVLHTGGTNLTGGGGGAA